MKIIFAGTPDFAVAPLLALHEEHEIVAVYTQPDRPAGRGKKLTAPPVKATALELGIQVHQPQTLSDQAEVIAALEADVMVVVAYGMLLPQAILDLPKIACINIHASLLPRWRGAAPIQRAIQAGDAVSGVSIMRMELGLDTGPVYQTLETPITATDTSASLHNTLAKLGAQAIVQTVAALSKDPNLQPVEQNHDRANYAHKISKAEANVDWSESAQLIGQQIRAFNPWPICQSYHQGERIRIWQASPTRFGQNQIDTTPGSILDIDEHAITVACGEGAMRLEVLQRAGSKAIAAPQFCHGFALAIGDVLDTNHG